MYTRYISIFLLFFVFNSSVSVAANSILSKDDDYTSYSFGVVPQFEQRKTFKIWIPILSELERRTGFHFILKGSSKIPDFEGRFMEGGFDLAYMNPYHLVIASDTQGYIPLIRDGSKTLNGVLVVRRDSGISDISELDGKSMAFPAPNALGASLLIRSELKKTFGIKIIPKYVQTHSSVYLHVMKKLVDVGGGVLQTLESQRPEIRNNLKVLYKTRSMAPHPITIHPRVPVEHQERILEALLAMATDELGGRLFSKIPIKKAVPASLSDYDDVSTWGLDEFYVRR